MWSGHTKAEEDAEGLRAEGRHPNDKKKLRKYLT